ncbi:MAG: MaoC family dehydratase [Deltaproteobacteria bacterium]|nr:MaoC family dehydratase [Deltaproteobacteria bacterium]
MADSLVIPSVSALKSFVGQRVGPSDWMTVGQEQIDAFARATGDHQWIHVDVERARRESPFGGPIAHGYLTIALAPVLLPRLVEVKGARLAMNYGLERMRLPAPVPAGARVRLSAELKNVRELPSGAAHTTIHLVFEVEGGDKPVCTADAIYLYFP